MKTLRIYRLVWLVFLMTGWISANGQYQQEVPGDNFSLEGALELFKKSASPEEFEKMLNDPDSRVNNLDLNGDGYIDYIRVIDMYEGNVHAFVIQALISPNESQDIAVITLEKRGNGKAVLQIIGDEDIYGIETIIEPTSEVYTYAGTRSSRVIVNVWSWPLVRYVYGPYYNVWVSPWGWDYRPYWWSPWRPVVYYNYYSYWRPYRRHYSICYTHRVVYAHNIYRPRRTTSVIVHKRHYNHVREYRKAHIDSRGRYQYRGDRTDRRRIDASVRYDANGRISARSSRSTNSRYSVDNNRSSQRISDSNNRSNSGRYNYSSQERNTANSRIRSNDNQNRNSATRQFGSSNSRSSASDRIKVQTQERTPVRTQRNESSVNTNSRRSFGNTSGSTQRSSATPNVQRSTNRNTGSSNIQRSTPSSSRNSSVQRSTGNSNLRRSTGSSNIRRSTGNSSVRSSSGSSSNRSSSINRSSSSRSSSATRPSGRSSSSRSSGSSSNKSRGRH